MNIAFQDSSILWILFCATLAIGYAALLYKTETKFPSSIKKILSIIRVLFVFLLAIFLFSPLITRNKLNYEKPIILVAQDNSTSIILNNNKDFYKKEYLTNRKIFIDKLSAKFDVKDLSIGAKLDESKNISYTETKTNLALLFQETLNQYKNRNLAAVVLASDGLHNAGADPESYIRQVQCPVYTVLLGDSTPQRDLRIINLLHNDIVYLKNDFLLEIKLNAYDLKNTATKLSVEHKGKVVWTSTQAINSPNQQMNVQAILNASEAGMQKYTLKASVLPGENNIKNNTRDIYIDVIENKQNIALIAAAAHPDLSAIKNSISTNENYNVDLFIADEFNASQLNKYQMLILHQLPSSIASMSNLYIDIEKNNIPCWVILGNQSYVDLFNRLPFGLKILNSKANTNEAFAVKKGDFQGFLLSNEWSAFINELPPLTATFGNYKSSNAMQSLFVQRIGSVITDQALLSFGNDGQRKYAILSAEGLWKWRIQNMRTYGNTELFDELNSKIVQYLSSKDDRRKFRVSMPSYKIEQGEKVYFRAELYNDSYELLNTPELKMSLKNEQNKTFDYVFSRTEKAYELELAELPAGEYSYQAECVFANNKYNAKGRFSILQNNLEEFNTMANFDVLRMYSKLSGAKAFGANEYDKLAAELLNEDRYKTISYEEKKTDDLINLKWIFFLLLALISAEWVLRKYHGSY
jgi:hypothetical protein